MQFKDFNYNEDISYFNLHVRSNKYRDLKKYIKRKKFTLDVLWSEKNIFRLVDYLRLKWTKSSKANTQIFKDKALFNHACEILVKVIRHVTGDESIRLHDCRHSFTNWTLIKLTQRGVMVESRFHFRRIPILIKSIVSNYINV